MRSPRGEDAMTSYLLRRVAYMVPTLLFISFVSFIIIQLPPGDFLDSYVAGLAAEGVSIDAEALRALQERYGLGDGFLVQYWTWMSGILTHGDFGQSFGWNAPVASVMWERVGLTFTLAIATLFFIWSVA